MASVMGCKTIVLWLFYIVNTEGVDIPKRDLQSPEVNLSGEWKQYTGWIVECSWKTDSQDELQSVRLLRNGMQYLVHRPQINGLRQAIYPVGDEFAMQVICQLDTITGQSGKCVTQLSPRRMSTSSASSTDIYQCEVSGERPKFILTVREYETYMPPSAAQITKTSLQDSPKQTLNCTSEGMPAPSLVWTSIDGNQIPPDFYSLRFNPRTKLWERWSSITLEKGIDAICTPQITTRDGKTVYGEATRDSASIHKGISGVATFLIIFLSVMR